MAWSSPPPTPPAASPLMPMSPTRWRRARTGTSAQFLFDPNDAAYVQNNWIYLDHDQRVTGSFGASYLWKHDGGSSRFYVDALYGSGLRTDATAA